MIYKNIEIFDTTYEGYGVGRLENGSIIFVPDTVTGDTVNLSIVETKKRFSYGKLEKVVSPSSMRIEPACIHASVCGGCQFMHITYKDQLQIKQNIINNAFRNVANFKINATISDSSEHYRLRVKFKLKNKRIGFFAKRSNDFIPIESCMVVKKSIFEKAREFAKTVDSSETLDLYVIENANGQALANISEVEFIEQKTFQGILFKDKKLGRSYIEEETPFGAIACGFTSFFQANRFLSNQFQQSIVPYLSKEDTVLELYSGSGFFSVAAASAARQVVGVDSDGEAIQFARKIKRKNLSFLKGNVEKLLTKRDFDFNTLVIDPPRAGLSKKVVRFILSNLPQKMIYISCNPMTMARDIEKLSDNYRIIDFKFFDMFPHTYHIESIVILEKK